MSNSSDKITISVKISKELHKRLEEQLQLLKSSNISALRDATTVEELVMFYLEHCTIGDANFKKIEERMQNVLDTLKDEGVDIVDLFNTFHKRLQEETVSAERDKSKEKKASVKDKKKS